MLLHTWAEQMSGMEIGSDNRIQKPGRYQFTGSRRGEESATGQDKPGQAGKTKKTTHFFG